MHYFQSPWLDSATAEISDGDHKTILIYNMYDVLACGTNARMLELCYAALPQVVS